MHFATVFVTRTNVLKIKKYETYNALTFIFVTITWILHTR